MSNGQGVSGTQQVAAPQATTSEQSLTHLHANNELLNNCLGDMRAFLSRAIGVSSDAAPQQETATTQAGVFGQIDEALRIQSQTLSEIREVVLIIEKIS